MSNMDKQITCLKCYLCFLSLSISRISFKKSKWFFVKCETLSQKSKELIKKQEIGDVKEKPNPFKWLIRNNLSPWKIF